LKTPHKVSSSPITGQPRLTRVQRPHKFLTKSNLSTGMRMLRTPITTPNGRSHVPVGRPKDQSRFETACSEAGVLIPPWSQTKPPSLVGENTINSQPTEYAIITPAGPPLVVPIEHPVITHFARYDKSLDSNTYLGGLPFSLTLKTRYTINTACYAFTSLQQL